MSRNLVFHIEQKLPLTSLVPGRYYKSCPIGARDFQTIFGSKEANRSESAYLRGPRQHPLTAALRALRFKLDPCVRRPEEMPGVTVQFYINGIMPDQPTLPLFQRARMRMIPDTKFESRFGFTLEHQAEVVELPRDPAQAVGVFASSSARQESIEEAERAHAEERPAPALYLVGGLDPDLLEFSPENVLFSREVITADRFPALATEHSGFIPPADTLFEISASGFPPERMDELRALFLAGRNIAPQPWRTQRDHLFVPGDKILLVPPGPEDVMSIVRVESDVDLMRRILGTGPVIFGVMPEGPPTGNN